VEDYPIDRILSSPTLRSQQTVQPLADDRFLEIEPLAALGMDAGPTQLRALFWDRGLHNVVLCTHGKAPAATSSRCRRQPRTSSQVRATDGLGGGVAAGAATGAPGTRATPGRRAALAAFTATASAQSRWPTAWRARSTERGGCS
jgi:hypothetical protein